ncbi:ATP-binding protein [Rhizobium beringeri]
MRLAVDTIARLTPLAESRAVDLGITRQDKAIAIGALADFEITLGNLVENAVRYTPPGGTVDVAVVVTGQEAQIEIRDTGPGIAQKEMPRVFERFFRARPQESEGSGLGPGDCQGRSRQTRSASCARNARGWAARPYRIPHSANYLNESLAFVPANDVKGKRSWSKSVEL